MLSTPKVAPGVPSEVYAPSYTVFLLTLGCAKNEADSRAMQKRLRAQGFSVCSSADEADFILLNTCAFIEAAVEESLDTLLELAALKRVQEGKARLLVSGCLPSRYGEKLRDELPEVAAFVPVGEEENIAQLLTELARMHKKDEQGEACEACAEVREPGGEEPAQSNEQPWAYVKISDGCSRHCSFCTIPMIRGPYKSYSLEHIRSEIDELIAEGVREIILIGQDTGIWRGKQEGGARTLAELLDALAVAYPKTWFRVMYLQPEGVSDALLSIMAAHTNIASYLDIPLQHASGEVLKGMNRRGCGAEYLQLLERIRGALPDVTLRTTVITGFPGEGRTDFEELCDFLTQARFDYVGVFPYSCEEGTVAAQLPHQVSKQTALSRAQKLRDLADSIGFERVEEKLDTVTDLLVCDQDDEGIYGRTQAQAPEVDGITYLLASGEPVFSSHSDTQPVPGDIVRVRITESVLYDLYAEEL